MEEKMNLEEINLWSLNIIRNNHDVKRFFKNQGFQSVADFLNAPVESLIQNSNYSYDSSRNKIRGVFDILNYKFLNKPMPITVKLNSNINFDFKHDTYYFDDITLERLGFSTTEKYLLERYLKAIYLKKGNEITLIKVLESFLAYLKAAKRTSISVTLIEKIELFLKAYLEEKERIENNAENIKLKVLRNDIDTLYQRRETLNNEIDKYKNKVKFTSSKNESKKTYN